MIQTTVAFLLANGLITVYAPPEQKIPQDKAVIVLGLIPGKFNPVKFGHADHAYHRTMPDGSRLTCNGCHHHAPWDAAQASLQVMRCHECHAPIGEAEKVVEGKVAIAMAKLKPDSAINPTSILFHKHCVDGCHREIRTANGKKLAVCKSCHERGILSDAVHGPYDAFLQDGTKLHWLKCPVGQKLAAGNMCAGEARRLSRERAVAGCPDGFRLPSRAEALAVLSCEAGTSSADGCGCAASNVCRVLFGGDTGIYWTADGHAVNFADGTDVPAAENVLAMGRCIQNTRP